MKVLFVAFVIFDKFTLSSGKEGTAEIPEISDNVVNYPLKKPQTNIYIGDADLSKDPSLLRFANEAAAEKVNDGGSIIYFKKPKFLEVLDCDEAKIKWRVEWKAFQTRKLEYDLEIKREQENAFVLSGALQVSRVFHIGKLRVKNMKPGAYFLKIRVYRRDKYGERKYVGMGRTYCFFLEDTRGIRLTEYALGRVDEKDRKIRRLHRTSLTSGKRAISWISIPGAHFYRFYIYTVESGTFTEQSYTFYTEVPPNFVESPPEYLTKPATVENLPTGKPDTPADAPPIAELPWYNRWCPLCCPPPAQLPMNIPQQKPFKESPPLEYVKSRKKRNPDDGVMPGKQRTKEIRYTFTHDFFRLRGFWRTSNVHILSTAWKWKDKKQVLVAWGRAMVAGRGHKYLVITGEVLLAAAIITGATVGTAIAFHPHVAISVALVGAYVAYEIIKDHDHCKIWWSAEDEPFIKRLF